MAWRNIEEGRKQRKNSFRKIALETVYFKKLNSILFVVVEKFWQVQRIFRLYLP